MTVIIKTFTTPGGKYVYDRDTNSLLSVNDDEFAACKRVEANEADDNDWHILKRYTDQGYLQESRLKEIEHPATAYMPFYLENGMSQLTMQVTQECNLRCSYCTYGGGYANQRTHSKKTMSLETMKKCVDFIMARSRNVDEVVLAYYGGEPLLEINKIKACMNYVKKKYKWRTVQHTITTNGTLLKGDILKFLMDNNCNVLISFDGPREIHDLNRVYDNGKGSFDDIMNNMNHIKKQYPEYYSKVMFITTVAPNVDFACVNNFFDADDILSDNSVICNQLNPFGATDEIAYNDLYNIVAKYQTVKLILSKIDLYSMEKISKIFTTGLSVTERTYVGLSKSILTEKAHPSGPCLPGVMRPFVDVDGNIFPCERVSEGSQAVQIGHIDTGFDMAKANAIINIGRLTETECKSCWNFVNCLLCVASCDKDGHLCGAERLKHCDSSKNGTMGTLKAICLLLENKHDFIKREV